MTDLELEVLLNDRASAKLKNIDKAAAGLTNTIKGVGAVLATVFTGGLIKSVIDTTARFEDLRTTLTSVTGSAKAGSEAFKRIKDFSTRTQFGVEDLTTTFIKLKSSGLQPTERLLNTFTDAAAVTTDQLGTLQAITDLFSRTTAGGLGLEELNRLGDRGLPVFDILREKLGLARLDISEFGKSAEGARKILEALQEGIDERFGGATQDRLKNLSTTLSNLDIAIQNTRDEIGIGLTPAVTEVVREITNWITKNDELARSIGVSIGDAVRAGASGVKFLAENIQILSNVAKTALGFYAGQVVLKIINPTKKATSILGILVDATKRLATGFRGLLIAVPIVGKIAGALGPIPVLVTAVVGALTYFEDSLVNVGNTSATVGEILTALWNQAGDGVSIATQFIVDSWTSVVKWFDTNLPGLSDGFFATWTAIIADAKSFINTIIGFFVSGFTFIGRLIGNFPEFFVTALKKAELVVKDFINNIGSDFRTFGSGIADILSGDFEEGFAKLGQKSANTFAENWKRSSAVSVSDLIPEFNLDTNTDYIGQAFTAAKQSAVELGESITGAVVPAWKAFESTLEGNILKQREVNRINQLANTVYQDHALRMIQVADATNIVTEAKAALNNETTKELTFLEQIIDSRATELKNILDIQNALSGQNNLVKELARTYKLSEDQVIKALEERLAMMVVVEEKSKEVNDTTVNYMKNFKETVEKSFKSLGGTIKENLFSVVNGTKSMFEGLRDIAKTILSQIMDAIIQVFLIQPLINSLTGGFGSLLGFGGFFADGGRVNNSSKPIIVGEKGPEMFIPNGAGQVISNKDLSMGGGGDVLNVTFEINAIDTQTGGEFIINNKDLITGVIQQAYNKRGKQGPLG